MQWIEAGLAAIIASLLPLIVAVVCWLFLGEKTGFTGILGLVAGFGGVLVIMLDKLSGSSASLGMALCLIGLAGLAAATLYVGRMMSRNKNVLMIVGLQMIVGCIILFPISLIFENWNIEWSTSFILAFLYTTLVPGLLGTLIWFYLVRRVGPVRAATFHFLNPFFGGTGCRTYSIGTVVHKGRHWCNHHHGRDPVGANESKADSKFGLTVQWC